jgi:signal peptidase I
MEPAVPNGALVLHKQVPASSLKVDDVVTVNRTDHNGVVTHRIVAIKPEGEGRYALTLRGDSNEQNDPQPYVVTQADRLEASVPYLGGVLMWMRQHPVVTAVILLALLGFSLWPAQRFTVHTADGQVLNNLTRREAKRYLDEAKAFRDQASAGVAGGQTPGQETNHAAAN